MKSIPWVRCASGNVFFQGNHYSIISLFFIGQGDHYSIIFLAKGDHYFSLAKATILFSMSWWPFQDKNESKSLVKKKSRGRETDPTFIKTVFFCCKTKLFVANLLNVALLSTKKTLKYWQKWEEEKTTSRLMFNVVIRRFPWIVYDCCK